jgi:hypothetical protein
MMEVRVDIHPHIFLGYTFLLIAHLIDLILLTRVGERSRTAWSDVSSLLAVLGHSFLVVAYLMEILTL